jgi:hypothetical protein
VVKLSLTLNQFDCPHVLSTWHVYIGVMNVAVFLLAFCFLCVSSQGRADRHHTRRSYGPFDQETGKKLKDIASRLSNLPKPTRSKRNNEDALSNIKDYFSAMRGCPTVQGPGKNLFDIYSVINT